MDEIQERVFILESPSGEDLIEGRREGDALYAALRLSEVPTAYFQIANKRMLIEVLNRIATQPKKMTRMRSRGQIIESKIFAPILHFSFHANKDGLALSSGEFIPWGEFLEILERFNDKYGWLDEDKSMVAVSLSACSGFSVMDYLPSDRRLPFSWLIGFADSVTWSDALVGLVCYYHLFICKCAKGKEAIEAARRGAGLSDNLFRAINWERKQV